MARAASFLLTALLLAAALFLLTALDAGKNGSEPPPASPPPATEQPTPFRTEAPESGNEPTEPPPDTPETDSVEPPSADELLGNYRRAGLAARAEIEEGLAVLRAQDPAWGELWTGIFEKMFYVNQNAAVPETVPEGLPEDESLCIVVFGFQLHPNGTMRSELVGRCEAALACAEAYPRAYIALTGGQTAADNRSVTEAGAMSRYLKEHGVAEERLILEKDALSTVENAVNLNRILTEEYPQINSLVIVSSSYHAPLCGLLMAETALLDAYETGSAPYEVAACVGYSVAGHGDWASPPLLADSVRAVAARKLNG